MTSERNPEGGFMNQKKEMEKAFPMKPNTKPLKKQDQFNQAMEERQNPYLR